MFDTMTLAKIVGGLCGSLLVFLLGGWAAELVYAGAEEGEEGEEPRQAYSIPVEETGGEASVEVSAEELAAEFQAVFASADVAAGEGEFRPCAACHSLEAGDNRTGPYLAGVVGRPVQSAEGFDAYSGALIEVADVWSPENLNAFLTDPQGYAPGTTMTFNGIRAVEDRANLIAYLATIGG